jgi:phytoene dehydrogenase-like protein
MPTSRVIVIGAGHNGLVVAAYLAKAGKKVTILERSDQVGGILRNSTIAPGFTAPGIGHTVGRLRRSIVRDLQLDQHGLELLEPAVRMFAPQPDGTSVTFWGDPSKTADELKARSPHDAEAFIHFDDKVRAIASFLAYLNVSTPPDVKAPSIGDAIAGLKLGKKFRDLGAKTGRETIRSLPIAVADLVQEVFEEEAVRGPLSTRGVLFTSTGVWAAGSGAVFLNDSAGNDGGAAGTVVFAKGGSGALADALAAAAAARHVEIRTGAEVVSIQSKDGRVIGVTLSDGTSLDARVVISAADPKRTLGLCDPAELGPSMVWRAGNIRQPGATAKVNLALSGLPSFVALGTGADDTERLKGRIVIGPSIDYVEKAMDGYKYGRVSEEPILECTIPTLMDPSLAPEGKHVISALFQAAPRHLRQGDWNVERDRLGDIAIKTLESYAPDLGALIEARQVITPQDFETEYGLSGGHVLHAEPGLDQFFAWRPLNGHARYRFVLDGLYLAGSGAHPGGGVTGGPGANAARQILADLKK